MLEFLAEPTNSHDGTAIKVVGTYKGWFLASQADLGYVPAATAEGLVQFVVLKFVTARLMYAGVSENGRITIEFQVIRPNEHKKTFDSYFAAKMNDCVFRSIVTGRFGIVTARFGGW